MPISVKKLRTDLNTDSSAILVYLTLNPYINFSIVANMKKNGLSRRKMREDIIIAWPGPAMANLYKIPLHLCGYGSKNTWHGKKPQWQLKGIFPHQGSD